MDSLWFFFRAERSVEVDVRRAGCSTWKERRVGTGKKDSVLSSMAGPLSHQLKEEVLRWAEMKRNFFPVPCAKRGSLSKPSKPALEEWIFRCWLGNNLLLGASTSGPDCPVLLNPVTEAFMLARCFQGYDNKARGSWVCQHPSAART